MNWISTRRQPRDNVKARQRVFFAMRRQETTTGRPSDVTHVEAAIEKKINPAELPPQSIKRIRGSFDIYALEGKEEYIKLDLWPSLAQDGCCGESSDRSMYEAKESHKSVSGISPVLATYDGQSRLSVADQTTQNMFEPDNSNTSNPTADILDDSRAEMSDDRSLSTKHERSD